MKPNFKEEKKLWKLGYKLVVGLDEAGRGPLAGPVTAAAVTVRPDKLKSPRRSRLVATLWGRQNSKIKIGEIKDSKKLSPKKREKLYKILNKHPKIKWGIGMVSEKVIDKINILEATKLAMVKAVKNLEKKIKKWPRQNSHGRRNFGTIDFLILDGNFKIKTKIPQKSIIKADEKVFSCAAASILAKVTRDRIMLRYHKKHSNYGFNKHKGYPTKYHREALKKYGPCKIHRKSFKPVINCQAQKTKVRM